MNLKHIHTLVFLFVHGFIFTQSEYPTITISECLKFNVEMGGVMNDSYSNVKTFNSPDEWTNGNTIIREKYSETSKAYNNYSLNLGCNAIIGKNKIVRVIFSLNYLQSKGEYNYIKRTGEYVSYSYGDRVKNIRLNYKSVIHFINFNTGLRFKIIKNLYISPSVSFNIPVYQYKLKTGFEKTQNEFNVKDSIFFKEFKTQEDPIKTLISFVPKLSYEFLFKNQRVGIYVSRNFGIFTHLP